MTALTAAEKIRNMQMVITTIEQFDEMGTEPEIVLKRIKALCIYEKEEAQKEVDWMLADMEKSLKGNSL